MKVKNLIRVCSPPFHPPASGGKEGGVNTTELNFNLHEFCSKTQVLHS
jgi:hypothetical protein